MQATSPLSSAASSDPWAQQQCNIWRQLVLYIATCVQANLQEHARTIKPLSTQGCWGQELSNPL
eukprot:6119631-Amphidinium_carterae.1